MKKTAKFFLIGLCVLALLSPLSYSQSRREKQDQPEKLMDIAGVKSGMTIGEAGAGSGFLTFFLSQRVGAQGHVYANDIDKRSLQRLNDRREREGIENITTVLGEVADPLFPVKDLDLVTMIWAFHDFTEKVAWLKNVKKYMKKDAAIFIFDGQNSHTGLNRETMKNYAEAAGFQLAKYEYLHGSVYVYELRINDGSRF